MTAQASWLLIAAGVVSALVGAAMMSATTAPVGRRRERAAARFRARSRGRSGGPRWGELSGAMTCTSVATGVIIGVQWAVVTQTGPTAVWAVVLGLPAFLAGATVARLLAVVYAVHRRRRHLRTIRRERGGRR
jgi:cytochrome c biogenesis protein CcdA